jgi:hypothetical protein
MGCYLSFPDGVLSTTTLLFDVVTDESWTFPATITSHPVETGSDVTDNVRVGLARCQLTVFCTNEPLQANTFTSPVLTQTQITDDGPDPDATPGAPDTLVAQEWNNALNFSAALKGVGSLVGGAVGKTTGSIVGTAVGGIAAALIDPAGPVPTPFAYGYGVTGTDGQQIGVQLYAQPDNTKDYVSLLLSALTTLQDTVTLITVIGSKNYKSNMVIQSIDMDRSSDTGTGAEFTIVLQEIRFVTTQTVAAPSPTIPRAQPVAAKGPQNPTDSPKPRTRSVMRALVTQSVALGTGTLTSGQISAAGLTPADMAGAQ